MSRNQYQADRPLKQQTQRQESPTKVGIIGSMYPHVVKGMAPGGGGGSPPPPGQEGPPEDKPYEGSDEEENEEDDMDEETVSVTTSSQVFGWWGRTTEVGSCQGDLPGGHWRSTRGSK